MAIKDSGARETYDSGMQRDVTTGKLDYTYVLKGPMLDRWAKQLMDGAKKYDRDNWMKADGQAELQRFRESAMRHLIQWLRGDTDEDHAAAVFFNINGAEYVRSLSTAVTPVTEKPSIKCLTCRRPATLRHNELSDQVYCDSCGRTCPCCKPLRDL